MIVWLRHVLGWLRSAFCAREDLLLENLALRQQLLALHAQRPRRRLTASHKLFWVVLRKRWDKWKEPRILATPRTSAAGTFRLVTFPYMGCSPHILQAHPGIVVPLCPKRDLSRMVKNLKRFEKAWFALDQGIKDHALQGGKIDSPLARDSGVKDHFPQAD
jgi:hypothetical protein